MVKGAAAALIGFVSLQAGSVTSHPAPVAHVKGPAFTIRVESLSDFFTTERVPNLEAPAPAPKPEPAPEPAAAPPAAAPIAAPIPAPVAVRVPAPAPAPEPVPAPVIVIGSTQQALINQDRAGAGLGALTWNSCLAGIAAQQAAAMGQAGQIFHGGGAQQAWGCGLNPVQTGENVGEWGGGANDAAINNLFLNSASHRANIMGPYHYLGTAWVVVNGVGYIAVEFA